MTKKTKSKKPASTKKKPSKPKTKKIPVTPEPIVVVTKKTWWQKIKDWFSGI